MTHKTSQPAARDWMSVLSKYRNPRNFRSGVELAITLAPYLSLWIAACWVLQYSYVAAFALGGQRGLFAAVVYHPTRLRARVVC